MRPLEYSQYILGKMKFDRRLFLKEYGKLTQCLTLAEADQLRRWVKQHYQDMSLP